MSETTDKFRTEVTCSLTVLGLVASLLVACLLVGWALVELVAWLLDRA